jgi:hypothetical protein
MVQDPQMLHADGQARAAESFLDTANFPLILLLVRRTPRPTQKEVAGGMAVMLWRESRQGKN